MSQHRRPKDLRCPQCGAEDRFRITAAIAVSLERLTSARYAVDLPGDPIPVRVTTDAFSIPHWDGHSTCLCAKCEHTSTVWEFRVALHDADCKDDTEDPDDV